MRTLRLYLRRASVLAIAFGLAVVPMVGTLAVVPYALLAGRRRPYRHALWLLPVGVLGGLSLLLAPPSTRSLVPWLGWLAIGTAFVLLAQRWTRSDALDTGFALAVAAPVVLGWELVQRFVQGIARPDTFTTHPNFQAGLLVALLGALATAGALQRGRRARWLLALAAVPALVGLVMTGSRGGMLGFLVGALVWLTFTLPRVRWRRVLAWTLGVLAVLAALVVTALILTGPPATPGKNLIEVSGFGGGNAPWAVGRGSQVVQAASLSNGVGGWVAQLVHHSPAYGRVLSYRPRLPVTPGERLTLSLWVRPAGLSTRTFVRVQAYAEGGALLARASRTTWTKGEEGLAGGYLTLPSAPVGKWQRVAFVLPRVPQGTRWLTLLVACAPGATGTYGEVDDFQLEKGTQATAYVAGPNPALPGFVDPLLRRWETLSQPVLASGGRLTMWRFGLRQVAKRPLLGYGPGSEVAIIRQYDASHTPLPLDQLHNFYLEILVQGGVLTLAALLAWLGVTVWALLKRARAGSTAAAAALATLVALLVHSVVDPVLAHHFIAGIMWLAVCGGLYGGEVETAKGLQGAA